MQSSERKSYRIATLVQYSNRIITMVGGMLAIVTAANLLTDTEFGLFVALQSIVQLRLFADAIGGGGVVALLLRANNEEKTRILVCLKLVYVILAIGASVVAAFLLFTIMSGIDREIDYSTSNLTGVLVVAASPITILLLGKAVALEGNQQVVNAAILRFFLSAGFIVLMLIALAIGAKIFSLGVGAVLSALSAWLYLSIIRPADSPSKKCKISKILSSRETRKRLLVTFRESNDLLRIWSIQWRMLLSWLGGYAMVFLPAPVLFFLTSPQFAGKIGVSLQVLQSICGFSIIALSVRLPLLSLLQMEEGRVVAEKYFKKQQLVVMILYSLGAVAFVCGLILMSRINPQIAEKFPSVGLVSLYALAFMCCVHFYTESIRMRSLAEEPFWVLYILAGLIHVGVLGAFGVIDAWMIGGVVLVLSDLVLLIIGAEFIKKRTFKKCGV